MLEEYAPFGVICSITPTTNPTETIINNTISMIAGGNTVVFNVHPRAKRVSADCLQALNTAIIEAGGPANLITMTREPTMENVDKMAANPKIRLMAGTGGMGMVNALLRSGKSASVPVQATRPSSWTRPQTSSWQAARSTKALRSITTSSALQRRKCSL